MRLFDGPLPRGRVPNMATPEEVRKLASLARIRIPEEKTEAFAREFDGILSYIKALESLNLSEIGMKHVGTVHNVFREDGEPHATGLYTEKLVAAFPEKEGTLLKVKQIISHD